MAPVEQRLGISRELSSMGIFVITLCNAALAPGVGMLAVRYSLRLLFLLGVSLSVLGYVLLATTRSYPLFLAA
jgi:predicted MFS family arabinose efflux permease